MQLKIKMFFWCFSFFLLFFVMSCSDESSNPSVTPSTAETKALLEGKNWRALAFRWLNDSVPYFRYMADSNWVYRFSNDTGVFYNKGVIDGNGFLYSVDHNKITLNGGYQEKLPPKLNAAYPADSVRTMYCLFEGDTIMYFNERPTLYPGPFPHVDVLIPIIRFRKQ